VSRKRKSFFSVGSRKLMCSTRTQTTWTTSVHSIRVRRLRMCRGKRWTRGSIYPQNRKFLARYRDLCPPTASPDIFSVFPSILGLASSGRSVDDCRVYPVPERLRGVYNSCWIGERYMETCFGFCRTNFLSLAALFASSKGFPPTGKDRSFTVPRLLLNHDLGQSIWRRRCCDF
jgi:hypothetical protein